MKDLKKKKKNITHEREAGCGPIISPQTLLYRGSSHQDDLSVSEECVHLPPAFVSIHKPCKFEVGCKLSTPLLN